MRTIRRIINHWTFEFTFYIFLSMLGLLLIWGQFGPFAGMLWSGASFALGGMWGLHQVKHND